MSQLKNGWTRFNILPVSGKHAHLFVKNSFFCPIFLAYLRSWTLWITLLWMGGPKVAFLVHFSLMMLQTVSVAVPKAYRQFDDDEWRYSPRGRIDSFGRKWRIYASRGIRSFYRWKTNRKCCHRDLGNGLEWYVLAPTYPRACVFVKWYSENVIHQEVMTLKERSGMSQIVEVGSGQIKMGSIPIEQSYQ